MKAVVVMGVSGCGKSSVAAGVAAHFGWRALDADDLHSAEAVAKMRAGTPLTDADRWPWLDRVAAALAAAATGGGAVVACSALRRAYRERLRGGCPGLRFVFLDGDMPTVAQRLQARRGHYMPPALLQSQFQTLEPPAADEADVLRVAIAAPLPQVVQQACAALGTLGPRP